MIRMCHLRALGLAPAVPRPREQLLDQRHVQTGKKKNMTHVMSLTTPVGCMFLYLCG